MPTGLSIYGTVQYKTRYSKTYCRKVRKWIKHRTGPKTGERWYKRRVKTCITRTFTRTVKRRDTRFTFWGTPTQVASANKKRKEEDWIPKKQFEDQVKAADFTDHPEQYAIRGEWIEEEELESP